MKIFTLHTLYRKDVCIGIIFTYLTGAIIAKGNIHFFDLINGVLLSFITFNFIYSFNQCTDWKTDKINNPKRSIPSKKVYLKHGLIYSKILFVISLIYPFLIFKNFKSLYIFLAFPIVGLLYSAKPTSIKNIPIIASFITATGFFLSIYVGFLNSSNDPSIKTPIFFYSIFLYLIFLLPFKDVKDFKGDMKYRKNNILKNVSFLNLKKIISFLLMISLPLLIFLMDSIFDKIYISILYIISILFILVEKNKNKIYKRLTHLMLLFIIIYFLKTYLSSMY